MFVGREYELSLLREHLRDDSKARLIILYGRRRIGKSTLIAEAVKNEENVLFFEGIEGTRKKVQIEQFTTDLASQTGRVRLDARNWREVFQGVGELLEKGRWVLVFDEFPWMGAGRTQIVSELKLYWDRWKDNPNICLFLCGSVASFMTQHVVHSRAFHNRKTLELCLGPLTPHETGLFIPKRGAREKSQLYMTLGGVPKYLEQIDSRISLQKNLNKMCFSPGGFFIEEYETLFKEQFRSFKVYESITRVLAQSPLNLSDLARCVNVAKGGGFLKQVENLIRAQFVREYIPVTLNKGRRSRTKLYKLTDPFLIFYFRYIHPNRGIIARNRKGENLFRSIAGPTLDQYYGYAFERLLEDSMTLILEKLGIALSDIIDMGPFFRQKRGPNAGLQIDWLIVRRDHVWTLAEFKYTASPVGKKVIYDVQQRIDDLNPPPDVSIEKVLISARGATKPVFKEKFFSQVLTLEDLV
ncbi:MAG: hypothetical protein GY854_07295 [Deltaproteobacteria bacterium]|nr:hypothetical protein [Deltaproteobacteria bacterium]